MRKLFFLTLFLILSCTDSDSEPIPNDFGLIEGFVNQDAEIESEPISNANLEYEESAATARGYIFEPMVDIEITDIGGLMAKTGVYVFELFKLEGDSNFVRFNTPIFTNNVSITKIGEFQYSALNNVVSLEANKRYLIRYFDENHDSVYDVVLPEKYKGEFFVQPQKIGEIEIEFAHYTYYVFFDMTGEYQFESEGAIANEKLLIRGVPDFKYQVKE